MLARVGPQARALGAEHERDSRRSKRVLQLHVRITREADAPEARLPDLVQRSSEIDHPGPVSGGE